HSTCPIARSKHSRPLEVVLAASIGVAHPLERRLLGDRVDVKAVPTTPAIDDDGLHLFELRSAPVHHRRLVDLVPLKVIGPPCAISSLDASVRCNSLAELVTKLVVVYVDDPWTAHRQSLASPPTRRGLSTS